ncbi:MAG: pyridoxamine 5'-phosphate oxidase family protein [Actinobacteria bacterium]|nr:pyridoxamine 5'-phosphate oxidase family protein [Actinomycetota bacterium]
MRWVGFSEACPEIAGLAEERFRNDEVVLVGTLRKDGSPRISPNEPDFVQGHLLVSMMWRSKKALDLLRDSRCVVHSAPITRMNPGGDVKLYGRAVDIQDPALRKAFREEMRRRIDWAPDEPRYHLFSIDVESAGYAVFGAGSHALTWTAREGLRRLELE